MDFQCARYGSPALDLVSLLYCCTGAELRKNYLTELLEEYCDSVVDFLTQSNCLSYYPDIRQKLVLNIVLQHVSLKRFAIDNVIPSVT